MAWIVDRFEEELAVLEDSENLKSMICSVSDLPYGVKEGDSFIKKGDRFLPDLSREAAIRRWRINEKFERLKKKG